MSLKNSNDAIGNRTRDLPVCSAIPQPTAPPRAPQRSPKITLNYKKYHSWNLTEQTGTKYQQMKGSRHVYCCSYSAMLSIFSTTRGELTIQSANNEMLKWSWPEVLSQHLHGGGEN